MRFLLVEDNSDLALSVSERLKLDGHAVDWAASLEQAHCCTAGIEYDLILLDIMLPDGNGQEFLQAQRQTNNTTPVIVMTAQNSVSDRVSLLDSGADDYVTKPFSPKELNSRINALLRRSRDRLSTQTDLSIGPLRLTTATHRACTDTHQIELGHTEFKLLRFFMENPERVFSRSQLLDHVWGSGTFIEERTVDVHILRLRKNLKPAGAARMLETVRGAGYRLSVKLLH